MEKINFDRGWTFTPDVTPHSHYSFKGSITVDLPHDYSIIQKRDPESLSGTANGFFPGGTAVYEKKLFVPNDWKNSRIVLEFEGVYMNSTVHINNQLISRHPYGYTSFHCDLTPHLLYNRDNTIKVTVNNGALPNTRWYSGSGIYRHVWILKAGRVSIAPWGVFFKATEVSAEASLLSVSTKVENTGPDPVIVTVKSTLYDRDGKVVATDECKTGISQESDAEAIQEITLHNPILWSDKNPYLYTLKSEILSSGSIIDSSETKVGIRSISFSAENGFRLNGVKMKLKGGCVHHDCGLLGSAAYDRAEERKVELLKNSGFNAIRCAHNPPSPSFLDACDRLGMLVIDEAFDCWRETKNPNDYGVFFEDWWQRDMSSMVLRDRNHPCIIMWSTGNEIIERDGRSQGYLYSVKLAEFIRSLDNTRAITNALCDLWGDPPAMWLSDMYGDIPGENDYWGVLTEKFTEPLEVVGYNYLLKRYESDGIKYPGRIICGTETFPKDAFEYWSEVERLPYVIGDFVWTSLDYLGEAGIGHVWHNGEKSFLGTYPWHQAFCGDIDICGFKRPQSYYRDCVWGVSEAPHIAVYKPEFHGKPAEISAWGWPDVVSSWTWPGFEGKPLNIEVYSRSQEVELFCNGLSLGRKQSGKTNRYIASFECIYKPGLLEAVAFDNGMKTSRTILKTAGKPASIRLSPDRAKLGSQSGDLCFVTVELIDGEGNIVHNASNQLFFTVCGDGSLLALGSSDPLSEESYTANTRRPYEGRIMAVVHSSGGKGEIVLTASAEGIPASSLLITTG